MTTLSPSTLGAITLGVLSIGFGLVAGCGRLGYDVRQCPDDMVEVEGEGNAPFCIESVRSEEWSTWIDAEAACAARGRRLCAQQEWVQACVASADELEGIVDDWEWVADLVSETSARKVGSGSCEAISEWGFENHVRYRCCGDR